MIFEFKEVVEHDFRGAHRILSAAIGIVADRDETLNTGRDFPAQGFDMRQKRLSARFGNSRFEKRIAQFSVYGTFTDTDS